MDVVHVVHNGCMDAAVDPLVGSFKAKKTCADIRILLTYFLPESSDEVYCQSHLPELNLTDFLSI